MSVPALLLGQRRLDVQVWVEDERLRCSARAGALTEALREELSRRRDDIVSFLRTAQAAAAQPRAIVPLQPAGALAPVYGVPSHGDVFCYRALARALGEERAFYGLQTPGLDGAREPIARVEELAAYFAGEIRRFQPRGPWIIAGYCIGGTVAFELARQLLGGGERGLLVLFGAPYPTYFGRWSAACRYLDNRARAWSRRAILLATQPQAERREFLASRLRRLREAPDPVAVRKARVEAATRAAVRAYRPGRYAGEAHLFMPCEAWARAPLVQVRRWRALAPLLETSHGPQACTHDDMLQGESASHFAAALRSTLARARL